MKPSITAADSGLESIQNNVWEGCWGEGWRQGHLKQSVCVYVRRRLLITRVAAKSMKVLLLSSGSHNTMPRQWFLSSQHNRQGRTSGCGYCYMTVDATCCRWRFLMFTRIILKNSDFIFFLSKQTTQIQRELQQAGCFSLHPMIHPLVAFLTQTTCALVCSLSAWLAGTDRGALRTLMFQGSLAHHQQHSQVRCCLYNWHWTWALCSKTYYVPCIYCKTENPVWL